MMIQYKPNIPDQTIFAEITNKIRSSLSEWYGHGSRLQSAVPEIRTYQYCFMLRYPVSVTSSLQKAVLVKIRRHPKMDSLHQAIQSDIHQNAILEYRSLVLLHEQLPATGEDIGAIRPLHFMQKYFAILMEEYPSQTLFQLMESQRSGKNRWEASELKDAARKTGRWLHYFHHSINTAFEKPYTSRDLLEEVRPFAEKIETSSRGRLRARPILEAFAGRLQNLEIEHVSFSRCHLDMTTNNVLYSNEGKVCVIDIKDRPAPVYTDLGLIITYPETCKPQIFSAGTHYSESLLQNYRAEIVAGYFDQEPASETLARVYTALKVVDKWSMYEELMGRYKGLKRALAVPTGPLVSLYFQKLLQKHLELVEQCPSGQARKLGKTTVNRL
jgi:hypothetical protein